VSDDITISGGSTEVASESLLSAHATLAFLSRDLDALPAALEPVLALGPVLALAPGAVAAGAQDAARLARHAATGIRTAASDAGKLAADLAVAAANYSEAERTSDARSAELSTFVGWSVGRLAPLAAFLGALALPQILATLATMLQVGTIAAGSPQAFVKNLGRAVGSKASALRDPRVVSLIRFGVSAADDTMLGAAGAPLWLTGLTDDRGTRAFGLKGATSVVVGAGRTMGLFEEAPVRVERTTTGSVAPPTGFADLAARVPPTREHSPQVRVERYAGESGKPTYLVYVGGTVDTSPAAGDEPFDLTSDLVGVAQLDPASLRATEEAMRQAGVQPGDTVIPIGYSQGGIVATDLAVSGQYQTPALVTFGSPTAGVDVPSATVDVAVEHTDDLVPALGGIPLAADRHGGDRILVTRQTFTGDIPPGSSPIDAHLMKQYAITAEKMDATSDPRLSAALAALPEGAAGESGLYRGIRVDPAPPPADVCAPVSAG
jgi:hypothetical protein